MNVWEFLERNGIWALPILIIGALAIADCRGVHGSGCGVSITIDSKSTDGGTHD